MEAKGQELVANFSKQLPMAIWQRLLSSPAMYIQNKSSKQHEIRQTDVILSRPLHAILEVGPHPLWEISDSSQSTQKVESALWCVRISFCRRELLAPAPAALMALIDCLAVINGHMLKHARRGHSHTDVEGNLREREGAISGEALISGCELSVWDGLRRQSAALVCGPQSRPTLAWQWHWGYLKK